MLVDYSAKEEHALQGRGRYLGTAFQLIGDLLDYSSDGKRLNRNVGNNLSEDKPTLPLLHTMHHGAPSQAAVARGAIEQSDGRHPLGTVLGAMATYGSLE